MALASIVYPHSWVNIAPADDKTKIQPNHVGKIMALLSLDRRPDNYKDKPGYHNGWVPVYLAEGNYQTVRDVMRGVDHALRQEFGDDLVNEEWQIKDVDDHTELKIKKNFRIGL